MTVPTRRDNAIKNLMKLRDKKLRDSIKNTKTDEPKEKNPEDVKKLAELWETMKKRKCNIKDK